MSENKKVFEVDEVKLAVLRPNHRHQQQAQMAYNRAFRLAVKPENGKPGAIVRAALEGVLREQRLWDDNKQAKWEELNSRLLESEKALAKGGIKLQVAREMAIQMRRDRFELRQLLTDRNSLDLHTAEAQAENARFNYLVGVCTVHADTGKTFWNSEDDYESSEATAVAAKAASLLGNMLYSLDDNYEAKLPENSFLVKYRFAREGDLHLINKEGKLVDAQGRWVDDEGRLINEQGELIDNKGNLLNEDASYKVEFAAFLDDDDQPVPEPGTPSLRTPGEFIIAEKPA